MYSVLATMTGNSTLKKNAKKWKKLNEKMLDVGQSFRFFTNNEWIFDTRNTTDILAWMS